MLEEGLSSIIDKINGCYLLRGRSLVGGVDPTRMISSPDSSVDKVVDLLPEAGALCPSR